MLGEMTCDDSVWIKKTHFPLNKWPVKFKADKIIYQTRHPIDCFPSVLGLILSQSHSVDPKKPLCEYDWWGRYINW